MLNQRWERNDTRKLKSELKENPVCDTLAEHLWYQVNACKAHLTSKITILIYTFIPWHMMIVKTSLFSAADKYIDFFDTTHQKLNAQIE